MKKRTNLFSKKAILIILSILICFATIEIFASLGYSTINNDTVFNVNGINLSESGEATWTVQNANSFSGTVSGTTSSLGCDSKKSGAINLTYSGGNTAKISFDYSFVVTGSDNSLKINNTSYASSNGSYNNEINKNESIKIEIESGSGSGNGITVNISNIQVIVDTSLNLLFKSAENGSYNVEYENGDINTIVSTSDYEYSGIVNGQFTLTAIPNDGYDLMGWYINDKLYSTSEQIQLSFLSNTTISIKFIIKGLALFEFEEVQYTDLNEAILACKSSQSTNKIILLIKSGRINIGNFEIPNGVTLYIPRDGSTEILEPDNSKLVGEKSETTTTPNEFRRLTIPDETTLTFESGAKLYIAGKAKAGQPETGFINGSYGHVVLEGNNSKIVLESGSTLYCYGYITGDGIVEVLSGSDVYEFFQIYGWRGGQASLSMSDNDERVFLINQYYVQNIESKIRFYAGSRLTFVAGVEVTLLGLQVKNATFIGDSGLFRISTGYIEREYDVVNDRIIYSVRGDATLSSISIDVPMINLDSSDYVLPINNNFTINVLSGSKITIGQDLALLPGVILNIEQGATMTFLENVSLYVYDNDSRFNKKYAYISLDVNVIKYSASIDNKPSRSYTADSPDAEININGEVILNNNASIYTTVNSDEIDTEIKNGANIHSSEGSGVVSFVSAPGEKTETYQCQQSGSTITYVAIPIKTCLLKNDDGTYFDPLLEGVTENNSVCYNKETGKWYIKSSETQIYKITYEDNLTGKTVDGQYTAGEDFTLPTADSLGFKHPNGFSLKFWKLNFGNSSYFYEPGETIKINYGDIILTAIWGGWIYDDSAGQYKYIDYETGQYITGLSRVISQDNMSTVVCLFNEDGYFQASYNGVYSNTLDGFSYYLKNGVVVENHGLESIVTNSNPLTFEYVYISKNNSLLCNDRYYIETEDSDVLPSGYYVFDENCFIKREDEEVISSNQKIYIKDDSTFIDGIRVAYGLFEYDNYLYYSDSNGYIVKDKTFYVSKINGYNVTEGLYYFNSEGKMCDESLNVIEVDSLL